MMTNMITDLLTEVKALKSTISDLRSLSTDKPENSDIFEILKLPVTNVEDLQNIENFLAIDDNFRATVRTPFATWLFLTIHF